MERVLNRSQTIVDDYNTKRNNDNATAKGHGLISRQASFTSITSTPHQSTTQKLTSNKFKKRNTNSSYKPNSIPPETFPLTLNGNYIINNKNICIDIPQVTALVMVHSAIKHFARRENIRTTYASRHLFKPAVIRVIFLLGLPSSNENEQKKIEDEAQMHGDVIQGNFVDTYHDLTHKAVMGLRWISENCRNAKYVIKVDDDAVFDMWKFLTEFPDPGSGKTMWCTVNNNSHIRRFGKWSVRRSQFRGLQRYPWPYCGGFVVVMNGELIPELFHVVQTSPFFWIDDVYVYGVLRHKVKDAVIKDMPKHFALVTNTVSVINCLRNKKLNCDFVAGMANEASFKTVWGLMTSKKKKMTISPNMLSVYKAI
ncbi:hypothetical protein SNE40_010000 [Patella caerulea]